MRKGFNPNKDKKTNELEYYHQVIIPVYIPHNSDYFKDSFKILQLTINSLLKTSHDQTFITIVNNGSSIEVTQYLDDLLNVNKIHELVHTLNIGKLNAILKGLSGSNFPLITISDADVLFLNNWQKEAYKVFESFPRTGFVCPSPSSKLLRHYTYNVIVENLFSNKMKFTSVKNPTAMKRFANSIGNPEFYNEHQLENYLTIENNNIVAVIGGGHFVGTYRGEVFKNITQKHSEFALGGTSEYEILDAPVPQNGFWRLSTHDNFAYHLGNTFEDWMDAVEIKNSTSKIVKPILKQVKNSKLLNKFKSLIFSLLFRKKWIWKKFLVFKGLSKETAQNY